MTSSADWASGPARWGAAAILGGAGLFGVARGVFSDREHDPVRPVVASVTVLQPAPVSPDGGVAPQARADVPGELRPLVPANPVDGSEIASAHKAKGDDIPALSAADDISVRISINDAPMGELQMLPRIGPVLAQRIVDDRAANGAFRSVSDLQRVRGIGPKTAEQLEPLVRFD